MKLLQLLCAIAIIAILATIAVPALLKAVRHTKWKVSYITWFHEGRIARAMMDDEATWQDGYYDVGLEDGNFQKMLRLH